MEAEDIFIEKVQNVMHRQQQEQMMFVKKVNIMVCILILALRKWKYVHNLKIWQLNF